MPIETASYISDLNTTNPPGSDPVGQADDHLRLLKAVLKTTFPNVNGPVTATPTQLSTGVVPTGGVIMWSGSASAIPTGWALCDGGSYTKQDGSGSIISPDLRGKFIMASGASTASPTDTPVTGSQGGATSATPAITVNSYALTLNDLPSVPVLPVTDPGHNHTLTDPGHTHQTRSFNSTAGGYFSGNLASYTSVGVWSDSTNTATTGISLAPHTTGIGVSLNGGGAAHTHIATSSPISLIPTYYTLAFIMKL